MARSVRKLMVTSDSFQDVFASADVGGSDGRSVAGLLFVGESSNSAGGAVTGVVTLEVTAGSVETFDIGPGESHPITSADRNTNIKRVRVRRAAGVDGCVSMRPSLV